MEKGAKSAFAPQLICGEPSSACDSRMSQNLASNGNSQRAFLWIRLLQRCSERNKVGSQAIKFSKCILDKVHQNKHRLNIKNNETIVINRERKWSSHHMMGTHSE
mmetsp:Transcript_2047/g.7358  ORF Transcript_2047/g.7358 Transcript_2047/m.7358 type:complete len:105 (-) Transcript_2047:215-529(-)